MKPGRQSVIMDIITHEDIETQRQLQEALLLRGVKSTQATLSRDIKDMRLVKELGPNGSYRYTVSGKSEEDDARQRLRKIVQESVVSYQTAMNLLVIKTIPGLASAICAAIDVMSIEGLVGTLAGDDTAFVAMASVESCQTLYHELDNILD